MRERLEGSSKVIASLRNPQTDVYNPLPRSARTWLGYPSAEMVRAEGCMSSYMRLANSRDHWFATSSASRPAAADADAGVDAVVSAAALALFSTS